MPPQNKDPAPEYFVVKGEIELPSESRPSTAAQLVIELEDVSRADAASQVVKRMRLPATNINQPGPIVFDLEVPKAAIDEKSLYSIRVHVDLNGSGEVERGDYITTQ